MKSDRVRRSFKPPVDDFNGHVSDSYGPDGCVAPFGYADYLQAKQALRAALERERLYALVVGTSGMGKTCLYRELAAQCKRYHQHVYLCSARCSVVGIVRLLARRLHLSPRRSYLETVQLLAATLRAHGSHWVLWLDDADQIDSGTLAQLRQLVEADGAPLCSVVLSALPTLASRLNGPSLFALKRRIALQCTLAGLRRDELDPFVVYRFGPAHAERLGTELRDELFERTQGSPALIDQLLSRALRQQPGNIDGDQLRILLERAGL